MEKKEERVNDDKISEEIKSNIIKLIGEDNFEKGQNMVNKVFESCDLDLNLLRKSIFNMIQNAESKKKNISINEEFVMSLMSLLIRLLSFSKNILRSDYYNQDMTKIFRNKTTQRLVFLMQRVQIINKDEGDKILQEEII